MSLPQLYWTEDEDPKNPGWCFRDRLGVGFPLEWTDRDDVEGAIEEARLYLLPEEHRILVDVYGGEYDEHGGLVQGMELNLFDEDDGQTAMSTQEKLE